MYIQKNIYIYILHIIYSVYIFLLKNSNKTVDINYYNLNS